MVQDQADVKSPAPRSGMALCLSGGGYRAALFHLGAVRRLNELGILGMIDRISTVSGGSILAAHLAHTVSPWPNPREPFTDWDTRVASPFKAFTKTNIRTWPVLKRLLLPWNWYRSSTQAEALARAYERKLWNGLMSDLPERPDFVFCATDMVFGVNWESSRAKVGDYQAGYCVPPPKSLVARAVAASSCFPPVFSPMRTGLDAGELKGGRCGLENRTALVNGIALTDGGVYDNMGLEPVWKRHFTLLVSDGGGVFPFEVTKSVIRRLGRYRSIMGRQAQTLRQRSLFASDHAREAEVAYWGIDSATSSYGLNAPCDSRRASD